MRHCCNVFSGHFRCQHPICNIINSCCFLQPSASDSRSAAPPGTPSLVKAQVGYMYCMHNSSCTCNCCVLQPPKGDTPSGTPSVCTHPLASTPLRNDSGSSQASPAVQRTDTTSKVVVEHHCVLHVHMHCTAKITICVQIQKCKSCVIMYIKRWDNSTVFRKALCLITTMC